MLPPPENTFIESECDSEFVDKIHTIYLKSFRHVQRINQDKWFSINQ